MRPVNVKNINYRDQVARRHRRIFILKIVAIIAGVVVVVAGLIYLLFFSRLFDVREVSFKGLDTVSSDRLQVKIDEKLNQKILGYLPRRNNLFFVNTRNLEMELASSYTVFKSINIKRKPFHGLVLDFLERKPAGIWCLKDNCSYFDEDKVLWGQPAKSSGFIFLTVDDERRGDIKQTVPAGRQVDDEFFKPIMEVAKSMAGEIKNVIIPADSFNEFRVYTADYYIIFTTDFDIHPERSREGSQRASTSYGIQNQLDVLKIFLREKDKDANFHPQYLDLRIEGRVYYK